MQNIKYTIGAAYAWYLPQITLHLPKISFFLPKMQLYLPPNTLVFAPKYHCIVCATTTTLCVTQYYCICKKNNIMTVFAPNTSVFAANKTVFFFKDYIYYKKIYINAFATTTTFL